MPTWTTAEIQTILQDVGYIFNLKRVIRYGEERAQDDFTESVGEHIFGMHIIADFFLPYEDPEGKWDHNKIRSMISWHDLDEVETGDMISWKKTEADKAREAEELQRVLVKLNPVFLASIPDLLTEYEARETVEAKFVKAIDAVEPLFHVFNPRGKKLTRHIGLKQSASERIKEPHMKNFPFIKYFKDEAHKLMEKEGYFVAE